MIYGDRVKELKQIRFLCTISRWTCKKNKSRKSSYCDPRCSLQKKTFSMFVCLFSTEYKKPRVGGRRSHDKTMIRVMGKNITLKICRHFQILCPMFFSMFVCLFSVEYKKTRTGGRRSHVKTMMNKDGGETHTWISIMFPLNKGYIQKIYEVESWESVKKNTRTSNQLPRPVLWTQTTHWLTILIRRRRTWTSED